ncbi:RelA/SpoT family protein [Putridiphycobacter roseus]|uniref:RelA/SpoT family protein n=1 Tax=Putridiphycobacter roseus TaxID=2219161 RepID=A0A2W1MYF6_9FLAO|nr:RelA/SpoT family protein [Putridiphycobacter roseus]PZE16240.1 RelA/SpoT family protein [Putridiphycobacter roseus]
MAVEVQIDEERERLDILNAYKGLLRASKRFRKSKEDTKMIREAFNMAMEAHKGVRRKSGEPYIYHPIAVARICAEEMGLGTTAIVAALLHDTVEDTYITLQDIEDKFGLKVRMIIDGLTKIPEVFDDNVSLQAENFRKLILTISDDLRVAFIKIADRLHNMRTLGSVRLDKKLKICSETEFLYAPLAHRLGFNAIKQEFEDMIFEVKYPDAYKEIEQKIEKSKEVRNAFIRNFSDPIKSELNKTGFKYKVKARYKSISSIYKKLKNKNLTFDEIYDIFAIRIIVDAPLELEKSRCWRVYSIVTDFYQPNPDRLRDWISIPKTNGYESLHTTVMSPTGKWVEVQIRSVRMDEIAEKGYAAHWKYKENNAKKSNFDKWLGEIRDLLENPDENAVDFIDEFKLNLFNEEIYVFTPSGDLRVLPVGGTTLDFAFDIHTDIGMRCIGAKVNGKLMPLSHSLKSGDQVEIITSSKQRPKEDWLKFVVTARAKQRIKASLKEEEKKIASDGKETLQRKFKQIDVLFNSENVSVLEKFYHMHGATELYYQIAKGKIDLSKLRTIPVNNKHFILKKTPAPKITSSSLKNIITCVDNKKDTIVIGEDFKNVEYRLANCCSPIPGDDVFGFITATEGIKIHRVNCPNATALMSNYAYRVLKAKWQSQKLKAELTGIKITGIDDMGIVNRITNIISLELNVNMKSISFESNDGIFEGNIMLYVFDTEHLDKLITKFEQIEGVRSVVRV